MVIWMPNLDIINDVTTEVTWDERKTNKQVIYQTTSLPGFVTFDAFYFCLWPKTLSCERYLGGKALETDHRCNNWSGGGGRATAVEFCMGEAKWRIQMRSYCWQL